MAQIRQVVSESLQATIRRLLPSQQGFTEDLQASNVIQPIIDLTPTAEGSNLPYEMQIAAAQGSNTGFLVNNGSSTIANTPGFYNIIGSCTIEAGGSTVNTVSFVLTDGSSPKAIWRADTANTTNVGFIAVPFNITVFLKTGDSVVCNSGNVKAIIGGSIRQIADVNGVLVDPSGYTPQ